MRLSRASLPSNRRRADRRDRRDRVDGRARYRRATALLLDDIQLLPGRSGRRKAVQYLQSILDADRQLVFTAPPTNAGGLEERISPPRGWLVVEIPSRQGSAGGVLERLLTTQRVAMEPALLDYLATARRFGPQPDGMVQRVVEAAAAQDAP